MYNDIIKIIGVLALFTILFASIIIVQANRMTADAKMCGDHWLKVSLVNQGIYSCQIYGENKKLIKKQCFMLPYKHWRRDQRELTGRIQEYDGDTISLDKGMKLLACDVPYQAELIQSVNDPVWVKYDAVDLKQNMYSCDIYSTKDGRVVSSGAYIVKKYYWDAKRNKTVYEDVKEAAQFFDLFYYGGISISLTNKLVLMPAGVVDYCTGPASGLRVKYDPEGNEIQREEY